MLRSAPQPDPRLLRPSLLAGWLAGLPRLTRCSAPPPPACLPFPCLCSFPSTELYKGSGALVQMQSLEQGAAAIQALNGSFPRGATQPLLVRFADSPGA